MLKGLITIARTMKIAVDLKKNYNFVIQPDDEYSIDFIMNMILVSKLSNKEIINEYLEMHTLDLKDLAAK